MAIKVNVTRHLDHLSSWGYLAGIALLSSSPARKFLHTILLMQGYRRRGAKFHLLDAQLAKFNRES